MKIKGICKNCKYHDIHGERDKPKYMYCSKREAKVSNLNLKQCHYFEQQSKLQEQIHKRFYKSNNQVK